MNLSNIFSKSFMFDVTTINSRMAIYLLAFFIILILVVVYIKLLPKDLGKIFGRFNPALLSVGVAGLIYLFAQNQALPWLGARSFLLLITIIFFVWIIYNLVWVLGNYRKIKIAAEVENRYNRYLPKPKKARSVQLKAKS